MMHATEVNYAPETECVQERVMSKPVEIEWITTVEAKKLLGVTSTQGVLNIVRGEKKPFNWIVRYLNIGTDEQPRYMLNRSDVEKIAKERKG